MCPSEILVLLDYIDEMEALIEADDGDIFTGAFLRKHDEVKEIVYDLADR